MRKHRQPNRRHPRTVRNTLLQHQAMQGCGIIGGGKHKFDTCRGAGERQAPACGMKHGDDRQQRCLRTQVKNGGRNLGHCVQHCRTVLVQHAFRVAGRAAGIAQHACVALVARRPFIIAIMSRNQGSVAIVAIKNDIMFDSRKVRLQTVDDWLEHRIVHYHLIFGVVHDVDQVLVEQPHVDRVDDSAKANCAIPSRQMPVMVHCKGCDPITFLQAEPGKCLRQLACFSRNGRPICSFDATVCPASDDFPRAVFARCIIDQMRNPKIPILHGALHQILSHRLRRHSIDAYFYPRLIAV